MISNLKFQTLNLFFHIALFVTFNANSNNSPIINIIFQQVS
jgi:hypothetical protein